MFGYYVYKKDNCHPPSCTVVQALCDVFRLVMSCARWLATMCTRRTTATPLHVVLALCDVFRLVVSCARWLATMCTRRTAATRLPGPPLGVTFPMAALWPTWRQCGPPGTDNWNRLRLCLIFRTSYRRSWVGLLFLCWDIFVFLLVTSTYRDKYTLINTVGKSGFESRPGWRRYKTGPVSKTAICITDIRQVPRHCSKVYKECIKLVQYPKRPYVLLILGRSQDIALNCTMSVQKLYRILTQGWNACR